VARPITITPERFTLVPYDAGAVVDVLGDAAEVAGLPDGTPIELEVDEELFSPLVGTAADVVDGTVRLWISGANLEDTRRPRHFSVERARADFVAMLLRARDRMGPCADARPDAELSRAVRVAWDVWAYGRAQRLGLDARQAVRCYEFRIQHGFTDAADAAFDRLWAAGDDLAYGDLEAVVQQTGAHERAESRVPVDLLRRRETSRIAPR
jgi:hypothetical protein